MRTLISTFILGLVLTASASAAPSLPPCVASVIHIQEDTFEAGIRATYPAVMDARINRTVRTWVQNSLHEFKATIAGSRDNPGHWKYMLDIGPSLSGIKGKLLGIRFQTMYFTGGAHPNHFVTTFNFDLETGEDVRLDGLFTDVPAALEIIAEDTRAQILPNLGDHVDETWFRDGTEPTRENYQFFTCAPEGLTFYFPPYHLAAYVFGQQQATVGWEKLAPLLAPKAARWFPAHQ
ncbi:RsiV family protein [Salidesulfovibrio onnuriiensis]|uniref:RsiV family protein n=1 Tax=Salidesulfovibrio onnuriiensis TaxID=2583823 RepID=UPI0011CC3A73|nr:RsiV family protein [Salidesulfovibrio onnuriiensis]